MSQLKNLHTTSYKIKSKRRSREKPRQFQLLPFLLLCFVGLWTAPELQAQCISTSSFDWDNGAGSGYTWVESDVSKTYTNVSGNGVDVTWALSDPAGQNCDVGNPSTFGDYTETTGGFGNGVMTFQMTSTNSSQFVEFKLTFSEAVLIDEFTITDIDYNGDGTDVSTFQDQITFTANNTGTNVPLTLSQHPSATASIVNITGQTASADYMAMVSGNVGHTDPNGAVVVSVGLEVTEFIFQYSNGPLDDGLSDDHAISISGFTFCKAPADTDTDGISDYLDIDDDNDGILDEIESCGSVGGGGNVDIDIEIQLDGFPGETSWSLDLDGGANITSGSGYSTNNQLISVTESVAPGDYTFSINDTYGDGLTASGGYYQVSVDGSVVVGPVNTAFSSNSHPITVAASSFSCLSGDPSADADDDGTLNYQDSDFCTLNANGVCTSLDTDGDGIIDQFDLDSDGDGCYDAEEAGHNETMESDNTIVASSTEVGNNGLDAAVESNDTENATLNYTLDETNGGTFDFQSGTVLSACSVVLDTDGDGIPDASDLDDDNDGIPDLVECTSFGTELIINGNFEDAYANWTSDFNRGSNNNGPTSGGCGTQGWVAVSPCATTNGLCSDYFDYNGGTPDGSTIITDAYGTGVNVLPTVNCNSTSNSCLAESLADHTSGTGFSVYIDPSDVVGKAYWRQTITVQANRDYEFSAWLMVIENSPNLEFKIGGISLTGGIALTRQTGGSNGTDIWQQVSTTWNSGVLSGTVDIALVNLTSGCGGNDIRIDDISFKEMGVSCDSDGDGIDDIVDLDSDNDGIPDIIEAGGTDTNGDGLIDYPVTGDATSMVDLDGDGLADTYDDTDTAGGTSGWSAGTSIPNPDSDGDGFPDHLDLDADNDGIPDIVEAGGIDTNGDGQVDVSTDSDNDGYADVADPSNELNSGVNEGTPYFVTGADSGNGNPTIMCASCDHDKDGNPDHLDLDADNDGIPDIVEAGGIDTNGDGRVDVNTDADKDGLADIYDTDDNTVAGTGDGGTAMIETDGSGNMIDGVTGASMDSDSDGNPDHLDIDADNDGIPDIVEVGGSDPEKDGMVDTGAVPWDVDGDGLADIYDTDDNTIAGTGDGASSALVITSADTNGDGQVNGTEEMAAGGAGSFSSVNEDGADEVGGIPNLPNHLDIDADNDGIVDNSEAQATNAYTGPTGYDDDGDGLDNAYDPDCSGTCTNSDGVSMDVTGAPMVLENTDMTGVPDWLDTDADNDGVLDIVEAGAGVDPGASPSDLDGDGLIWDDATATNGAADDPTNSNDTPATFDDVDDPGVDQDWRQGDCPLCKVVYGIQDGSGTQTTTYEYNPISKLLELTADTYGVIRTNRFCEIDGWRYYYNPADPSAALFAMRGDAADLDKLDYIEIRVGQAATDREAGVSTNAYSRLMNRDWFVKMQSPQTNPIDIRFYYPEVDFGVNGYQAADAAADTYNLMDAPDIKWFKVPGWDVFDPASITATADNLTGMTDFQVLTPVTEASTTTGESETDGSTATVGNGKNYVQFDDLTSFSGGTAGWGTGASALPVNLKNFSSVSKGCTVELSWLAEREVNFSHYELQWSGDGKYFETLDRINALADAGSHYFFEDIQATDDNYYRLKLVDLNGTFEYSKTIQSRTNCLENRRLGLYPNPVSVEDGQLMVKVFTQRRNTEIVISDLLGRTVKKVSFKGNSKDWMVEEIDVKGLSPGTYNLRVLGQRQSQLFVITR